MKTKIFLIALFAIITINSYGQNLNGEVYVNGTLYMANPGAITPVGEYGKKLWFGGYENGELNDIIWMARYNRGDNQTDLRINIGDDRQGDDRFTIGNEYWADPKGYTPFFVVRNDAKVGIGTENPQYTLDVNGTMRAKEVRVESGWADFVFDKDYKLPTLNEVKAHIDEHKHLPGIPSAEDVQENGLSVADMTAKMMQKIEELTLYVIQQNEQIENQNTEMKKQNKEIQFLKEQLNSKK